MVGLGRKVLISFSYALEPASDVAEVLNIVHVYITRSHQCVTELSVAVPLL